MTISHNSYLLLGSLLVMIVMSPILENLPLGRQVMDVLFCVVIVSATLSLAIRVEVRLLAVFLALAILIVRLTGVFVFGENWFLTGYVLSLILIVVAFLSLMKSIIMTRFIDMKVITDAISSYLLIGVAWALVFLIIHTLIPTAFEFGEPDGYELWTRYVYLSFMTLTTLGYGDITSDNSIVQIWSVLEAVVGVLFQAILIARLVSLYGSHVNNKTPD